MQAVLTLGTFDGVHRGHQALLKLAARRLRAGMKLVAVAFEKPPRLYFRPEPGPQLLTLPSEKTQLLERYGVQRVVSLRFGQALAATSASDFARTLRDRWDAREVVVGFNFVFGKDRAGDGKFLAKAGKRLGFLVHRVPPLRQGRATVSSGWVRALVWQGDMVGAASLLGHPYLWIAEVIGGRGLGAKIGIPTANLAISPEKILPHGVFAVAVTLPSGIRRRGILNIGHRPTVGGGSLSAEVHILDYSGNLRGQELALEFARKLREERRFPSIGALVRQIKSDEARARQILSA